LGLTASKWGDLLGLTDDEYAKKYNQDSFGVQIDTISTLAETLDLSMDSIFKGDIDYTVLARHCRGDLHCISERYVGAASLSPIRSVANLLSYVEFRCGDPVRQMLMRNLQLHSSAFSSLDRRVNILLVTDLAAECRSIGLMDDDFIAAGEQLLVFEYDRMSRKLEEERVPKKTKDIYSYYIEGLPKHVERTFSYEIAALDNDGCVIHSDLTDEVRDGLKTQTYGSKDVCLMRKGILSCPPAYGGLPRAKVEKMACVHQGDDECVYDIRFLQKPVADLDSYTEMLFR
jgi:hypothetical protein